MGFRGYKFKFELHASHLTLENSADNPHYHNFTIVLYLSDPNHMDDEVILYEQIEMRITDWLNQYQNKYLTEMELFQNQDTTIEAIGDIFFVKLQEVIFNSEFDLIRLDIYENPIHIYSVSDKLLDSSVNILNLEPKSKSFEYQSESPKDDIVSSDKLEDEVAITQMNSERIQDVEEIFYMEKFLSNYETDEIDKPKHKIIKLSIAICFMFLLSVIVMVSIKISGTYPRGSDTLCHIYRSDVIFHSIKSGIWYPLYDKHWYNGVEIMRYWGPVPLYLIAMLQYMLGGNVLNAYIFFVGSLVLIGGCGWLLFGWKYNRIGLSALLGILWFLFPENIRVLIAEGNLPRALICALLPFLFYYLWTFIEEARWQSIIGIILINALIGLCHAGMAMMLLFSLILFIFIHGAYKKSFTIQRYAIVGLVLSFMLIGIWLIPSLNGGAVSKGQSTNQVMKYFFQNAFASINPIKRYLGNLDEFYFGFSIFIISISGVVLGNKKVKAGFLTSLLIFLSTSLSAYSIFIHLPFSQFLWMIRFITIALALAFMSILMWKNIKKSILVLICIMLILDTIPSYKYIYVKPEYRVSDVYKAQYNKAESLGINQAKGITNQRLTVFDLSRYGAYAPYYIAGHEPRVQYTYGAGWEGAKIASNIVQLNTALTGGNFYYLFDRCLELGDDTILLPLEFLNNKQHDINSVIKAGQESGYKLVSQINNSLLFQHATEYKFGTITKYESIAIGESSSSISLLFPSFKEGGSSNLDDYSVNQLIKYKKIYLSGFTYDDKKKTEQMLDFVAKNGTEIFIDMNKIPVNSKTNRYEIFGVSAQSIAFQENYPELFYGNNTYKPRGFVSEEEEKPTEIINWNTVYLNGLKNKTGFCTLDNKDLVYSGTMNNPKIHFLGLNLLYHAQISGDEEVKKLLEALFDEKENNIPQRKIVPLTIEYKDNEIIIDSEFDHVNTSLALLDIFHSNQELVEDNNLLIVDKGKTIINIKYPYFQKGMTLSVVGIIATIIFLLFSRKRIK